MDGIKPYLMCVLAAALVCSIVNILTPKGGTAAVVMKLLCGIFLAITVISPLIHISFANLALFREDIMNTASDIASDGAQLASEKIREVIKNNTEEYITNEAATMDAQLVVHVVLTDLDPPVPESVTLKGAVSPLTKTRLSQWIADEIGIAKEMQIWES